MIASRILFSVSVAFVLTASLVARLITSSISRSVSIDFVLKAVLMARLVISSILFSISPAFVLRAAVVAKSIILGILFSVFLYWVFFVSQFLNIFFVQISLSLRSNLLVLGNSVSMALTMVTNLSSTVFFWQHHHPLHQIVYLFQQRSSPHFVHM